MLTFINNINKQTTILNCPITGLTMEMETKMDWCQSRLKDRKTRNCL